MSRFVFLNAKLFSEYMAALQTSNCFFVVDVSVDACGACRQMFTLYYNIGEINPNRIKLNNVNQ